MASWSEYRYPVMEQFLTVQGEGAHTGKSAWFIRLGGCDVGCAWCDVKESWDVEAHPKVSCAALVKQARESGAPICVVTGGEPAMHDLGPLTKGLRDAGLKTHIETSGAHKMSGEWDWVTLSPKRFKAAREDAYAHVDELKVVVVNRQDILWGEPCSKSFRKHRVVFSTGMGPTRKGASTHHAAPSNPAALAHLTPNP